MAKDAMSSKLLSPDFLALAGAAASGGVVEVIAKATELNLSAEDLWPVYILVGMIWLKETVKEYIEVWKRPPPPEIIAAAAEAGAQAVIDKLRHEKE